MLVAGAPGRRNYGTWDDDEFLSVDALQDSVLLLQDNSLLLSLVELHRFLLEKFQEPRIQTI